ncbi:MAG: DUF1540 domain-containing protein [bacterium]|nr:DUF1540 domain-containing protein [bacterium]MDD3805759.1 DUF1540 domain-containing protein [bacterium]MDD4152286.1 DUF1540 domain-containing protein [bacterium]MDD4557334.1 DUF1540 domain-containing protein [bacterium]
MRMPRLPRIKECDVIDCFYNTDKLCHASAITVGSPCPKCDTYLSSSEHGKPADMGQVGACHEDDCRFNHELTCHAQEIVVGHHQRHADCFTYSPEEGKREISGLA